MIPVSAHDISALLRTPLTERLGCRYPIIQTAMGWVADANLVIATTRAGGFGFLAGATIAAALKVAAGAAPGSVLLAVLPDTGERYFSTPLFEGVNEGSDDDWLASLG